MFTGVLIGLGREEAYLKWIALVLDVLTYVFLPLWTTVVLRVLQGRHWLHRLGARSVVIGDIPWVSQSVEQFASKLFARGFSISSIYVWSSNPVDQLVHKFTHRVCRGKSRSRCGLVQFQGRTFQGRTTPQPKILVSSRKPCLHIPWSPTTLLPAAATTSRPHDDMGQNGPSAIRRVWRSSQFLAGSGNNERRKGCAVA